MVFLIQNTQNRDTRVIQLKPTGCCAPFKALARTWTIWRRSRMTMSFACRSNSTK